MISILLIVVVAVLAAAAFTVWVVLAGTRALWRLVAGEIRPAPVADRGPRCRNSGCGVINVDQARFCRRCGSAMGSVVATPIYPRADRSRSVA